MASRREMIAMRPRESPIGMLAHNFAVSIMLDLCVSGRVIEQLRRIPPRGDPLVRRLRLVMRAGCARASMPPLLRGKSPV